jgi:hypothetical protein
MDELSTPFLSFLFSLYTLSLRGTNFDEQEVQFGCG